MAVSENGASRGGYRDRHRGSGLPGRADCGQSDLRALQLGTDAGVVDSAPAVAASACCTRRELLSAVWVNDGRWPVRLLPSGQEASPRSDVRENLLSNAFKFTEQGGIRLDVSLATGGWSSAHPVLTTAPTVIAFEVSNTDIGIPSEKQRIIFEAFHQADAGTSRK
jgi:hypothetical protein